MNRALAFLMPFGLCGCAALASFLGAAAPVAVSALDAYAATARTLAGPAASSADIAAVAVALAERDRCTVEASHVLMPEAGTSQADVVRALDASAAAATKLAEVIEGASAGKDGGA